MEKDLTNSPFEVFGSLLQKKYNCTKHNARDNNYSKWMLNLSYNCYITNWKQTNKKYALIYNYSVYVTGETWWPSQQIRLPTTLSQANKFHFARFSSYTIKTYWTRTFPYSITNISILIQGYNWEVTGTNRTYLAWILFWSEFFTTVLWSLFPVNTCKWERIHHQHHHYHQQQGQHQ